MALPYSSTPVWSVGVHAKAPAWLAGEGRRPLAFPFCGLVPTVARSGIFVPWALASAVRTVSRCCPCRGSEGKVHVEPAQERLTCEVPLCRALGPQDHLPDRSQRRERSRGRPQAAHISHRAQSPRHCQFLHSIPLTQRCHCFNMLLFYEPPRNEKHFQLRAFGFWR